VCLCVYIYIYIILCRKLLFCLIVFLTGVMIGLGLTIAVNDCGLLRAFFFFFFSIVGNIIITQFRNTWVL
jgi:hypothetical protein